MTEQTEVKTMKVYKYPIEYETRGVIELHEEAEILSVGDQLGDVCLWAKADTTRPLKKYMILVVGTGTDVPEDVDDHTYHGTVIQTGISMTPQGPEARSFVWHVWGRWA